VPDDVRVIESAGRLGLSVFGAARYCVVVTLNGRTIIDLSKQASCP
jgi:hypothetical protein